MGWNKNGKGMFGPKYVDLSKTMDPKKLERYKLIHLRSLPYVIFIYKQYVLDERRNQ